MRYDFISPDPRRADPMRAGEPRAFARRIDCCDAPERRLSAQPGRGGSARRETDGWERARVARD